MHETNDPHVSALKKIEAALDSAGIRLNGVQVIKTHAVEVSDNPAVTMQVDISTLVSLRESETR